MESLRLLIYPSLAYERVSESANYLMSKTKQRPKIAIICGSGLGKETNKVLWHCFPNGFPTTPPHPLHL